MADWRGWLRWGAVVAAVAVATNVAFVVLLPRVIMEVAHPLAARRSAVNALYHAPPITAANQEVVRSSPDLIYSICAFDLSDGPLRVTAPLTGAYMSLSCYQMNTVCFFVRNDRQVGEAGFDIVLVGPHDTPPEDMPEDMPGEVVRSPSNRGLLLFRNFAGDGAQVAAIEAARSLANCAPLQEWDTANDLEHAP